MTSTTPEAPQIKPPEIKAEQVAALRKVKVQAGGDTTEMAKPENQASAADIKAAQEVRATLLGSTIPDDPTHTFGDLYKSVYEQKRNENPNEDPAVAERKAHDQAAQAVEKALKQQFPGFGTTIDDYSPITAVTTLEGRGTTTPPPPESSPQALQPGQEAQPGQQPDTAAQRAQDITAAENHQPPLTPAQVLELTARGKDGFQELRSAERAGTVDKLYTALEQDGILKDPKYAEMLDTVKSGINYDDAVAEILKQHPDTNSAEYKQAVASLDKTVAVAAATQFLGTPEGAKYAGEDHPFAKAWKEVQAANAATADKSLQQEAQKAADAIAKDPNSKEAQEAVKNLWERYKESKAGRYLPSSGKEVIEFVLMLIAMFFVPAIPLGVAGLVFSKVSENAMEDYMQIKGAAKNKEQPPKSTDPTGQLAGENVAHVDAPAAAQPAAASAQSGETGAQTAAAATGATEAQPATTAQAPKPPEPAKPTQPVASIQSVPAAGATTPPVVK